jgi:hypothetical protein
LAKKQSRKPAKKAKPARAAKARPAPAARAPAPAPDASLSPVQQALARRRAALAGRLAS